MPWRLLLVAFGSFLILSRNLPSAQAAPQTLDSENVRYVLRVQHVQEGKDFCVLVRADGQYHWELHLSERAEIFEGTLDQTSAADLSKILNSDGFRHLKQDKIVPPLAGTEIDRLVVLVGRPEGTQGFEFLDKKSREPFREAVDPLLAWLDWLRKQPHKELSEEAGRNNCLPPKEIELKKRPPAGTTPSAPTPITAASPSGVAAATSGSSPAPAATTPGSLPTPAAASALAPANPYLMRVLVGELSQGEVKRTCVIVYTDAHYRMERSSQKPGSDRKSRIFQASLTPEELQELRRILDDPMLKDWQPGKKPARLTGIMEGDSTTLWLPGGNGVEQHSFSRYRGFGARHSDIISHDDTKPVKPLRQWLKSTLEGKKIEAVKDAIPNDCAPGR